MDVSREKVMIELRVGGENYNLGELNHCREVVDVDGEE